MNKNKQDEQQANVEFLRWKEAKRNRDKALEEYRNKLDNLIYSNRVTVRVKEMRGFCEAHSGHIGKDVWRTCGCKTEGYICPTAYDCIYQTIFAMKYGATLPHQANPDVIEVSCNDPLGMCIFELRREKISWRHNAGEFHILAEK